MIDQNLSELAATHLRASGQLMAAVLDRLPEERLTELNTMLAGGMRIGLESTIDASGGNRILLVGLEIEGNRRILAEVTAKSPYDSTIN